MPNYSDYEKITDDILLLGNRVILRMNVSLSSYLQEKNNKRISFHREIEYYSNKNNSNLINIKRNFDYYMTIEHTITKDYIRISITDILKLRHALDISYNFFIDKKYENMYAMNDGEIIMMHHPEPVIITGLSMGKYLKFEPIVFLNFRGETERGLRMYLSSESSYCDISINKLEAFKYIMDTINIFECAQNMLNYIQRPDYGYNMYSFNTIEDDSEIEEEFKGVDGREITSKKSVSFFDKMKELE